jgi:hypothetical protein
MLCPNFSLLKKGIKTGDINTVIKKPIRIVKNRTFSSILTPPSPAA